MIKHSISFVTSEIMPNSWDLKLSSLLVSSHGLALVAMQSSSVKSVFQMEDIAQ